jgi:uncharacterized protein with HEPN domain
MSPSLPEFIRHMIDECAFIIKASHGKTQDDIINDEIICRAVVRSLEIIGEATKNLSKDFTAKYPHIDWKHMAGMRDRLIHFYFGVNYEIVCDTIFNDIPELHNELKRIIELEGK